MIRGMLTRTAGSAIAGFAMGFMPLHCLSNISVLRTDEVIQMKAALLSLALLGGQTVLPISDRVPIFNVEASCAETIDENKRLGIAGVETLSDCMQEEMAAQKKLNTVWVATALSIRDHCEGDVRKGLVHSYVNLLTCVEEASSVSTPPPRKGASQERKPK